ncbi:MAG TPA: hypothetical protein ENF17_02910 [Candidatus Aminicenantes bacterium]|nr:hypothetical protein [Candidatus Aminicenantes bacterium]
MNSQVVKQILGIILVLIFSLNMSQDLPDEKARKVLEMISFLEGERLSLEKPSSLRRLIVTEEEFNAYIAYRLRAEQEEFLKTLKLKFLPKNRIEGQLVLVLPKEKIKPGLASQMIFLFGGKLIIEDGKGKFDLKSLYLNNQPISPGFLDFALTLAAKISGEEYNSLTAWYELPLGIKDIKLFKGQAEIYY